MLLIDCHSPKTNDLYSYSKLLYRFDINKTLYVIDIITAINSNSCSISSLTSFCLLTPFDIVLIVQGQKTQHA